MSSPVAFLVSFSFQFTLNLNYGAKLIKGGLLLRTKGYVIWAGNLKVGKTEIQMTLEKVKKWSSPRQPMKIDGVPHFLKALQRSNGSSK